jgi:hypothetical protein
VNVIQDDVNTTTQLRYWRKPTTSAYSNAILMHTFRQNNQSGFSAENPRQSYQFEQGYFNQLVNTLPKKTQRYRATTNARAKRTALVRYSSCVPVDDTCPGVGFPGSGSIGCLPAHISFYRRIV